jgi:hypothetical protein
VGGEDCTATLLSGRADARHQPPPDTAWHCAAGLDEIARVLTAISKLGIAVQSIGPSGSDFSADLRQLLGRVLSSAAAEPKTLTLAAQALKRASGHDFAVWCQYALPDPDKPPRLPLLRAAIAVADSAGTAMLAMTPGVTSAVRDGLRSRSSSHRAQTFAILRDMVCAAPHQLASRVIPLKMAVMVEVRTAHARCEGRIPICVCLVYALCSYVYVQSAPGEGCDQDQDGDGHWAGGRHLSGDADHWPLLTQSVRARQWCGAARQLTVACCGCWQRRLARGVVR